ncbi:FixH family protein [Mesorhizobium sp. B2-3-13]|uniref:FixH family protein n=1 Tax=Mesorhizobium sp. B2-3-13 TaxID=2589951 RepID=UPI00112AFFED|nr:FixH family protein [Mesorhizobium sp. B2-3-13]TPL78508.1 FixH family protein [Mesorhizobium sp. B2-3-13]
MSTATQRPREFTGRHMLAVILAFFGVVIGVNVLMATLANTSWTGLVVENTYVASQEFNKKAEQGRAQAALGWKSLFVISDGDVRYSLADAAGKPIALHSVKVMFRHPAYEKEDELVILTSGNAQEFGARHQPKDGVWIVEVDADAGLSEPYREVRRLIIAHGEIQ